MEIVYDDEDLKNFVEKAVKAAAEHPILIDKSLEDAIEEVFRLRRLSGTSHLSAFFKNGGRVQQAAL